MRTVAQIYADAALLAEVIDELERVENRLAQAEKFLEEALYAPSASREWRNLEARIITFLQGKST